MATARAFVDGHLGNLPVC
jgi:hypothetical protein